MATKEEADYAINQALTALSAAKAGMLQIASDIEHAYRTLVGTTTPQGSPVPDTGAVDQSAASEVEPEVLPEAAEEPANSDQ